MVDQDCPVIKRGKYSLYSRFMYYIDLLQLFNGAGSARDFKEVLTPPPRTVPAQGIFISDVHHQTYSLRC